jgi:hypothetical protein
MVSRVLASAIRGVWRRGGDGCRLRSVSAEDCTVLVQGEQAELRNAASRAPANAPAIATRPNRSAVGSRTFPARQWPSAPARLVVPTIGRLIAIAVFAPKPST